MSWEEAFKIIKPLSPDWPTIRYHKCRAIYELARRAPPGDILELGTFQGLTAITMSLSTGSPVHTLDDYVNKKGWAGEAYGELDLHAFVKNCAKTRVTPILHIGNADDLCLEWTTPLSMIFWDLGGKRLASDFARWEKHVLTGGLWVTKDINAYDGFGHEHLASHGWRNYIAFPECFVYAMVKIG